MGKDSNMINPREALQEALDEKLKTIQANPSIRLDFFVKETATGYPIRIWLRFLGKLKEYTCEQEISKALFEEAKSKEELAGHVDFVVDAIAKRISFEARYV